MAYIGSLPASAVVGLILRARRLRPQAALILALFPLACASIAVFGVALLVVVLPPARGEGRNWAISGAGLLILVPALPVALAYCLIAGVPWRSPKAA